MSDRGILTPPRLTSPLPPLENWLVSWYSMVCPRFLASLKWEVLFPLCILSSETVTQIQLSRKAVNFVVRWRYMRKKNQCHPTQYLKFFSGVVTQLRHKNTSSTILRLVSKFMLPKQGRISPGIGICGRLCSGSTWRHIAAWIKLPIGNICLSSMNNCQPKQNCCVGCDSDEQEHTEKMKARGSSMTRS